MKTRWSTKTRWSMKSCWLPLVALLGLPSVAVADFRIYGKGNVSFQAVDESGERTSELVSNASRLGVRGSETLREGLEVIYQLEYEVQIDDGDKNDRTFNQRDSYIGLRGRMGSLIAGKLNTPLKNIQDAVDLFNDLEGDLNYLFAGEVRADNVVQYISPAYGRYFTSSVAYIAPEEDGLDPGVSAATTFQYEDLYLAVGGDSGVQAPDADLFRIAGRYSFAAVGLHVGALYEFYDDGVIEEEGSLVSLLWEASEQWAFKLQGGTSDINHGGGEAVSVGVDYRLSPSTKLYGYYTNESRDLGCGVERCEDQYLGAGLSVTF